MFLRRTVVASERGENGAWSAVTYTKDYIDVCWRFHSCGTAHPGWHMRVSSGQLGFLLEFCMIDDGSCAAGGKGPPPT